MTDPDVLIAADHVISILGLKHPNANKKLHPAVIGAAIFYLQKYTKLNGAPPNKLAAKENGNIAMIWEETVPPVAIDVHATQQSADILMTSADGTTTRKTSEEGTDAKALETVVNILAALTTMSMTPEVQDGEPETGQEVAATA
jgi:hypothetical protein